MPRWTAGAATAAFLVATAGGAQDRVTASSASFIFNGQRVNIGLNNPDAPWFVAAFTARGDACGAPCIAPLTVAPGVETLDENQVLAFLMNDVAGNSGLMVDARDPDARAVGFIPGTVSLPHRTLAPDNAFKTEILLALGARAFEGVFNFTDARSLLVYDGGPSSNDAGKLIENLLAVGYPASRIKYYRGGMQVWSVLGFSIDESQS